jgi:D-serine deaminase-like pyridoxal phosphate-dependent protein
MDMKPPEPAWFAVSNSAEVPSPSLLVYPERVEENLRRMLAAVGEPERLRPHMKTHKMPELIRLQVARGISKFKCATVAEAEMTAASGATDVLLAYQMVGPNVERFLQLQRKFPGTRFSTIADDEGAVRALSKAAAAGGHRERVEILLDVDCGQHRCGIEPGAAAGALYQHLSTLPGLANGGLHVYDGHIHDSEVATRTKRCDDAYAPVTRFRRELIDAGHLVPRIVAGGTPTFPMHARRPEVECSPGTCVLWDAGYSTKLPDLDFLVAATVLTRVISKPGGNRLCLDLGHKAVAAENPHPRVLFPQLPGAQAVTHSEEHLVVETAQAGEFCVGDCLYGIPWHICPTVALHSTAVIIRQGRADARWAVAGRERVLSV